ncbi:MAG: hypothetical protein K6G69_00100 [Lachnospiraceae bacterium]|nr:hypothetical protein [Lachnospiraceae bacterium]
MSAYLIGVLSGVAVGLLILYIKKKMGFCGIKGEYDERQLRARGDAYKKGFLVTLILGLVTVLAGPSMENYISMSNLGMISLLIGLTVFAIDAIMHDALLGFDAQPVRIIVIWLLLGLTNIIGGIRIITDGSFSWADKNCGNVMNLFLGVAMTVIVIAFLLKNKIDNKTEED